MLTLSAPAAQRARDVVGGADAAADRERDEQRSAVRRTTSSSVSRSSAEREMSRNTISSAPSAS
jgi:hypothetical protein